MPDNPSIGTDQLKVGLYVYLDLSWFEHPFALSHFKIKSEEQIRTIRGLGLKSVRYDPALSDIAPPAAASAPAAAGRPPAGAEREASGAAAGERAGEVPGRPAGEATGEATGNVVGNASDKAPDQAPDRPPEAARPDVIAQALAAKRAMVERIRAQRDAAARIENAYLDTARTVREFEKNIYSRPAETVRQATQLVRQIADSILSAPELAIHVMGDKTGGEELYLHSLNVTTLSMMMARDIQLPQEVVGTLGMGALFHDIGRKEIPNRLLMKTEALTQAERHLYEMHCQYGVDIGQRLQFPPAVLAIVREHHELFDGSGYPQRLKGEQAGLLSRIVVLTNHYDCLCNPNNLADALTPHEALSLMFARLRAKFDPKLLQVFIRCLGVYPPGTIVQLSNGAIGMIATVNTAKPMKPMIVVYDAEIPKEDAILIDLERETDMNIAKAIRPAQVPIEIYNYLSPRKRVSYYFDAAGQPGQAKGGA